ncbi:MAG: hypothetical protein QM744_01230 [Mesorhizobium sp.]
MSTSLNYVVPFNDVPSSASPQRPSSGRALSWIVPLSIGGGQSVHAHHSLWQAQCDLHKDIAGRYKGETNRALAMLERVSPDLAKQVTATLRKAQAADLRAMRRIIREEAEHQETSGVASVVREYHDASEAEHEALNAL